MLHDLTDSNVLLYSCATISLTFLQVSNTLPFADNYVIDLLAPKMLNLNELTEMILLCSTPFETTISISASSRLLAG